MGAEFTEDLERADTDAVPGRLRKEGSMSIVFVYGLGIFTEDCGLVCVSS